MKILTNRQMREADAYTITQMGVPSLTLMERAGVCLADECEALCATGKLLCVCGGGNNGGDGFVCARILQERGREVDVVCVGEKFSPDCKVNFDLWKSAGGKVYPEIPQAEYAVAVDCLFGTGFRGALAGREKKLAEEINALRKRGTIVLSADIPSGVNGENGSVEGIAVRAQYTLAIGEVKAGVLLGDGREYAGKIHRADIGICLPEEGYATLSTAKEVKRLLPARKRNSHKGNYGRAAIVAGSAEYTGAAYLSAAACLRAGAGYTALFAPKDILPYYILKAPEILLKSCSEGGRYAFNEEYMQPLLSYDAIAYGMGMGQSEEVYRGAKWLLERYEGKLLLDADGLNSLAAYGKRELPSLLKNCRCDLVVTPHGKEFSRLSGLSTAEIFAGGLEVPKAFAKEYGVTLLLKNALTVITDGRATSLNGTGNSGQAKGGSGDVLSGLIAGLMAQGADGYAAAVSGAYLAGKAAELAARKTGEYSLIATDCIEEIGGAFLFVTENADEDCDEE